MNPIELKQRTKSFALRIIKLSRTIPKSDNAGQITARQIIRSGTSVVANYRATCRARSKAEFIAKIGTVEEESDETALWLELLGEAGITAARKLSALLQEANDLTAIMAASRKTASGA
ncbi:MAG TPA: four helix bundle protein [Candidatus Angelobacter sp.]|nr:four helix bundle protein [Candidatus Angelobacter sp.]